ncbi:MAG: glycine/sarcosine/betaine reductase component B subunit [Chloroflexota bacterium]
MALDLAAFQVDRVSFGDRTAWSQGTLTVDRSELTALATQDRRVRAIDLAIATPGESARIINVHDVLEPRLKVEGPGVVYPGVCGRDVTTVGTGRTHRLAGLGLVECVDTTADLGSARGESRGSAYFIEMSGPGAVQPYGALSNLVLTFSMESDLSDEDWDEAKRAAVLRIADRLAETTVGQTPTQVERFDLDHGDPGLPRVVFVANLRSAEHRVGPRSGIGTAVYGVTRLSAPWLLRPTEILDGAITRKMSWLQANNPVVLELARRHGTDVNFVGCIIARTNWTSQWEKRLAALRVADMAQMLGAQGAVTTVDVRGNRFIEAILGVQACEQRGIMTTLCTVEEPNEDGQAPALIFSTPENVSAVSCGDSDVPGPFPAVQRVLGAHDPAQEWYAERPGEGGGHIARYWVDYYGWGKVGCVDY